MYDLIGDINRAYNDGTGDICSIISIGIKSTMVCKVIFRLSTGQ